MFIRYRALLGILLLPMFGMGQTPPAWEVNPSSYAHYMTVVGKLELYGVPICDDTAILAAFSSSGEVRGLTTPETVDGCAMFFLVTYSNAITDTLYFKVWLNGITIDIPGYLIFQSGSGYGSADNPLQFSNTVPLGLIPDHDLVPTAFMLWPAYPNPFNPVSTIRYDLPQAGEVSLVVYDIMGREVVNLVNQRQAAGYHELVWNGKTATGGAVPSGVYIALMRTPTFTKSIKMVLIK